MWKYFNSWYIKHKFGLGIYETIYKLLKSKGEIFKICYPQKFAYIQ